MESTAVQAVAWLALAATLGIGELVIAGTFFLLPFAAGALIAAIASLLGAAIFVSFPLFVVVSFVAFLGFRPLAGKLDSEIPQYKGIGANRLIGNKAITIEAIGGPEGSGMVKIEAEEWRAECHENFQIPVGAEVRIVEVRGTRVLVEPV